MNFMKWWLTKERARALMAFKDLKNNNKYPGQNAVTGFSEGCVLVAFGGYREHSFRNLIKATRNLIVFTIFRLIWNQTDTSVWIQINEKMVNTIWFRVDLTRFREKKILCVWPLMAIFQQIGRQGLGYIRMSRQKKSDKEGPQLGPNHAEMKSLGQLYDRSL